MKSDNVINQMNQKTQIYFGNKDVNLSTRLKRPEHTEMFPGWSSVYFDLIVEMLVNQAVCAYKK